MTKEERVLRILKREEVDYLPSMITFADRTRDREITEALGLKEKTLDEYLENHLSFAPLKSDYPLFFRNDIRLMRQLEKEGFCTVDEENKIVYDSWGMGIRIGSDGFFVCFNPLAQKNSRAFVEKYMPPRIHDAMMADTLAERIRKWTPPDPVQPGNYDWMQRDLESMSGEHLVIPCGSFGIYERSYGMISIPELLAGMASTPSLIEELLDKITDYKVAAAKHVITLDNVKVGHMGDDLGTQTGPFFSLPMFRKMLKPRFARLWDVFKSNGKYVIMHSCGNVTTFLPDLIEIGLDVLEPVQPVMDLKYLKKTFGRDLVFWGGIDTQELLPYAAPEEVKRMASETIHTLGKGGGYIIAPAQEVMKDVPLKNVVALLETIIEERSKIVHM